MRNDHLLFHGRCQSVFMSLWVYICAPLKKDRRSTKTSDIRVRYTLIFLPFNRVPLSIFGNELACTIVRNRRDNWNYVATQSCEENAKFSRRRFRAAWLSWTRSGKPRKPFIRWGCTQIHGDVVRRARGQSWGTAHRNCVTIDHDNRWVRRRAVWSLNILEGSVSLHWAGWLRSVLSAMKIMVNLLW